MAVSTASQAAKAGRRAGRHDRHLATRRLGGTARNRCIEHQDAQFTQAFTKALGHVGSDRRAENGHRTRRQRCRRTVLPEERGFGLIGIDHQHDQDLTARGDLCRRRTGQRTQSRKIRKHAWPHIANTSAKALPQQRARHTSPH
jgi:hypothetical protein